MIKKTTQFIIFVGLLMAASIASATPISSGLELWLDAGTLDTGLTSVSTWSDQSGHGRNSTAAGTGSTPTYIANNSLFSNHATVSFDGNDFLSSALGSEMNIDGNNARTIFFVFSQDAAASRNIFGYGSNATFQLFDVAAAGQEISGHFHGTPFVNGTQTFATNQMTVGTVSYDGTTFETYQHDMSVNTQTSSAPYTLNTGDSTFRIGGGVYSPYNYFNGDIAEILVYSGALSASDRNAVDNYLYNKYTTNPAPVPEPGTILLLGTGLAGLSGARRRRKK